MKYKKCQLDFTTPCQDKGFVCIKSAREKEEYNKYISQIQERLESLKFAEPSKEN